MSASRETTLTLPGAKSKNFKVRIRCVAALNIRSLVDHLRTGAGPLPANRHDLRSVVNAINALYRQAATESTYCATETTFYRRSRDVMAELTSTEGVLEALRSIYQRLSLNFSRLSLNVDVACAAFFVPDKSLVDIAAAFAQSRQGPELERAPPAAFAGMKGVFFRVRHLPESSRFANLKIRVNAISTENAIDPVFNVEDPATGISTPTSVAAYFANKYNIRLRFPGLPVLLTKNGAFPMEVCWTAPSERFKEALQGPQTADFIQFATSRANIRQQHITANVGQLAWHQLPMPWAIGITVDTKMLELPAQILKAPIPEYANRSAHDAGQGKWNLRGKNLKNAQKFSS